MEREISKHHGPTVLWKAQRWYLLCLPMVGGWVSLRIVLKMKIIPFIKHYPHDLITASKLHLFIQPSWRLGIQHTKFGETRHSEHNRKYTSMQICIYGYSYRFNLWHPPMGNDPHLHQQVSGETHFRLFRWRDTVRQSEEWIIDNLTNICGSQNKWTRDVRLKKDRQYVSIYINSRKCELRWRVDQWLPREEEAGGRQRLQRAVGTGDNDHLHRSTGGDRVSVVFAVRSQQTRRLGKVQVSCSISMNLLRR